MSTLAILSLKRKVIDWQMWMLDEGNNYMQHPYYCGLWLNISQLFFYMLQNGNSEVVPELQIKLANGSLISDYISYTWVYSGS